MAAVLVELSFQRNRGRDQDFRTTTDGCQDDSLRVSAASNPCIRSYISSCGTISNQNYVTFKSSLCNSLLTIPITQRWRKSRQNTCSVLVRDRQRKYPPTPSSHSGDKDVNDADNNIPVPFTADTGTRLGCSGRQCSRYQSLIHRRVLVLPHKERMNYCEQHRRYRRLQLQINEDNNTEQRMDNAHKLDCLYSSHLLKYILEYKQYLHPLVQLVTG